MALKLNPERLRCVLLADGWHEVASIDGQSTFGADAYGASWRETAGDHQFKVLCPLDSIIAVKDMQPKRSRLGYRAVRQVPESASFAACCAGFSRARRLAQTATPINTTMIPIETSGGIGSHSSARIFIAANASTAASP